MKKTIIAIIIFFMSHSSTVCFASDSDKAEALITKALTARNPEAKYEYLHKAKLFYLNEYEENSSSIPVLTRLSYVYQLLGERAAAKKYINTAYNIKPYDSEIQKLMGDFYYNFGEYSTAIEYYKLALSTGLLKDFETNIRSAKCYEKLGDSENAELYYKVSNHINGKSKEASKKVNSYVSSHKTDNSEELEQAKYKYLFKKKKLSETEQTEQDVQSIIDELNL